MKLKRISLIKNLINYLFNKTIQIQVVVIYLFDFYATKKKKLVNVAIFFEYYTFKGVFNLIKYVLIEAHSL